MHSTVHHQNDCPSRQRVFIAVAVFAFIALLVATSMVFLYVPNERVMGPVQRILYFHVGSASATYVGVFVVFTCGVWYLATRDARADAISYAATEVAFVFCTIVMLTGMIWGNAAWNTVFRMEPRLVSSLLLWILLFSLILLRLFSDPQHVATHCAVVGIIAALTVPVVVYSIEILPQVAQLHPQVVEKGGLQEPSFRHTLSASLVAVVGFAGVMIWLRAQVRLLEFKLRCLKRDLMVSA